MDCEKLKCFYGCGKSFSASEIKNHHQNECSFKLDRRDASSVCSSDSKEPKELNFKSCPKCLRYVEKSRFQSHLNEHDEASKSCKYCGKEIPFTIYKRHVELCKEKKSYAGENVVEVVHDIPALCPLCSKPFPYKTIFHHGVTCIKKYVQSAQLHCPICEKKCHVIDIGDHISQCRKKELFMLNCLTCDKQLSSRESAQHITKCKAESDEVKFICRVCKEELEVPLLSVHFDFCMQKSKLRTKLTCVLCAKKIKTDTIHSHTILCCHDVMKSIKVICPVCEEQFLANKFDDHMPCQQKKSCPWCEIKYPDAEFMSHVEQCDKRQIECIVCNKAVLFTERKAHQQECINKNTSNQKEFQAKVENGIIDKCKDCGKVVTVADFENHPQNCRKNTCIFCNEKFDDSAIRSHKRYCFIQKAFANFTDYNKKIPVTSNSKCPCSSYLGCEKSHPKGFTCGYCDDVKGGLYNTKQYNEKGGSGGPGESEDSPMANSSSSSLWRCRYCTFLNSVNSKHKTCEMCSSPHFI